MIVGHHIIFSAYGFWLPNDPRGSWSTFVGAWDLFRAGGKATKTTERRSLAYDPHDRVRRLATKQRLQRPAVKFNDQQVLAIACGFKEYIQKSGLSVWACAIMPDHVHLVTGDFRLEAEKIVIQLKSSATKRLVELGIHPFQHLKPPDGPSPKCFAEGEWKVFLDPPDVPRAIRYVEDNPDKDGLPRQTWPFVTNPI